MKKEYIKPEMALEVIEMESMIASSYVPIGGTGTPAANERWYEDIVEEEIGGLWWISGMNIEFIGKSR